MELNSSDQLLVVEQEPNTAVSITAAQSHKGRMAQAGKDESDGQETITEHQDEEYEQASSAPGSIGGEHMEIQSEKIAFEDKR